MDWRYGSNNEVPALPVSALQEQSPKFSWVSVSHAYNPNYLLGGREQEDLHLRTAQASSLGDPTSKKKKKNNTKKG
jgi:hypothetical protein